MCIRDSSYSAQSSVSQIADISTSSFAEVIRGYNSLGTLIVGRSYTSNDVTYSFEAVPTLDNPTIGSTDYSSGGYTIAQYGSSNGGKINGIDVATPFAGFRDNANAYRALAVILEESVKILFKVLYGVDSKIIDLEQNLIKPSSAEYIRREVLVADVIGIGEPQNLVGQTIFKSNDLNVTGSVSEVEVFSRDGKTYYKISLFVGFDDIPGLGEFSIAGFTKSLYGAPAGSSILSVDSTVGFGTTGTVSYTHLTLPTKA